MMGPKNKIDADTKFAMQCMSFAGIVAALRLITWGLHTWIAWAGLVINLYSLILWIIIEEAPGDKEDAK